jgi:hypothetical protein
MRNWKKILKIMIAFLIVALSVMYFRDTVRVYSGSSQQQLFEFAEKGWVKWVDVYPSTRIVEYRTTSDGWRMVEYYGLTTEELKDELNSLGVHKVHIKVTPFYKSQTWRNNGLLMFGFLLVVIAAFLLSCIFLVRQVVGYRSAKSE